MKQGLLSPSDLNAKRDLPAIKWTLSWMQWYIQASKNKKRILQIEQFTLQASIRKQHKTFILYKQQMLRLLAYPKPLQAQIAIELPCLMGFRTAEVASWRAEYLDFQNMNTQVLDSKKHVLFTVPLSREVAKHVEELLAGRMKGTVLQSTSNRNRGEEVVPMAIWHIWRKWTTKAKLPNAVDISPLTGRRFFAAYWYHWLRQSLMTLSKIMRHQHPAVTLHYVSQLIFYEDMKADYHKFERKLAEDMRSQWLTVKEAC